MSDTEINPLADSVEKMPLLTRFAAADAIERTFLLLLLDDVRTEAILDETRPLGLDAIQALTDEVASLHIATIGDVDLGQRILAKHSAIAHEELTNIIPISSLTASLQEVLSNSSSTVVHFSKQLTTLAESGHVEAENLRAQMVDLFAKRHSVGDLQRTTRCALYGLAVVLALGTGAGFIGFVAGAGIGFECLGITD